VRRILLPAATTIILFIFLICLNYSCKKVPGLMPQLPGDTSKPVTPDSVQPNIILILADDVGFEVPTCDGGESYSTPNIDRMAAEGIRFTECHSAPLCSPSRFELLTGKYNFRNYGAWGVMDTTNRTLANMLRDAGYHTLVTGKWQLDGGNASIHAIGFEDYIVHGPYTGDGDNDVDTLASIYRSSAYKDPDLYYDSKKLTDAERAGKYGEDIYMDTIFRFIDDNSHHPFFIYYPMSLCHYPFVPPPNNPDFAKWNNKTGIPDTSYFPDMVAYMDQKIGELMQKLESTGLDKKTILIFTGDNGTDGKIVSRYNDYPVKGGKSKTYETGTRVPLLMWSPGNILAGQVNDNLIDFSDFMPTLADMAHISKPTTYGILDGISFYPLINGGISLNPRQWVFCHYDQNEGGEGKHPIKRWVQNTKYKLYDSTGKFFDIKKDLYERSPIPDDQLTPKEKETKAQFASILSTMHN
jgi:arylsulfatase A